MRLHSLALAAEPVDAQTLRFDAGYDTLGQRQARIATLVASEYHRIGCADMMAIPSDLRDHGIDFNLSERLVSTAPDTVEVEPTRLPRGLVLRIRLRGDASRQLRERVRLHVAKGSCGLCGLDTIEQVLRPLPKVPTDPALDGSAVSRALEAFDGRHPLRQSNGAAHAEAYCAPDGTSLMVREEIGRHHTMDKLIGALARTGLEFGKSFILLTARCSYELSRRRRPQVARHWLPSPRRRASRSSARASGLTLVALVRRDNMLMLKDPHGTFAE
jgi:FdhD protein